MSGQTGKWREDQVLVICPGSQTTMAQLGCGELTPPAYRLPTRMFRGDDADEWRPYRTFKRRKASPAANGDAAAPQQPAGDAAKKDGDGDGDDDDEYEWVEDPDSAEGAVYPIQGGRIVHMDAFLAFLEHVHGLLTTTYHNTPIMLMASPQWTRPDCEAIARYVFEKTRTPALCLIHSGVATQYGLKWPTMTVVDVGFEKVDVTCIYDSRVVGHRELGFPHGAGADGGARDISGGEVFTRKLQALLKDKAFTHEMAEQLKKSSICEVLPYVPDSEKLMELPAESGAAPSQAAPVAAPAPAPVPAPAPAPAAPATPAAPAAGTTADGLKPAVAAAHVAADDDDDEAAGDKAVDSEGVLDVATIVTSGQTKEFLAKKEKEKAERAKARKQGKGQEGGDANRPARLPNSRRVKNVFHYEEVVQEEKPAAAPAPAPGAPKEPEAKDQEMKDAPDANAGAAAAEPKDAAAPPATNGDAAPKPEGSTEPEEAPDEAPDGDAVKVDALLPPPDSNPSAAAAPAEPQARRVRRDIEVGLERFTFADRDEVDRIVTTIYRAVQGVEDMYMRPSCWENLVFVGNGCRLRGLKENILQTLSARHVISPSSATMFTSELPSNLATPSGTGSQTPVGSFGGPPHQLGPTAGASSVNPLLQAATTASLSLPHGAGTPGAAAPGSAAGGDAAGGAPHSHHFHSQTPTAVRLAPLPTYLSEWTKNGFEEAMFLGAQVAARLAFCVHNMDAHGLEAQRMMSLNRVDYNETGPKGIRTHSMLG